MNWSGQRDGEKSGRLHRPTKRMSCVHIHFTCVKIQYLLRSMNLLDPLY